MGRYRRLVLLIVSGFVVIGAALVFARRRRLIPREAWQSYQQGRDGARARRYGESLEALGAAVRTAPSFVDAYVEMGNVYLAVGRNIAAMQALGRAADLDPRYPHVYCQLAEAFMRQRDLELAKLHLDVALAADANCAHAQFLMGEFYRSKEDYRRCERHLKRAVALDPNVAIVWRTLADVYLRLSQFDAAETAINKAIALQPQQASAHYVRGVVLRKRATTPQEWQRSEEAFQKAAQLSEGDPMQQADAYFDMARIEEERGNEAAAVRLYQRVLRLDPERRQAHYQLAQLYIRQKKQTEADRHLKEFQRLNVTWKRINQLRNRIQQAVTDRETADASLELAQIYVKMNLSNKAIGVLQEVLREQPTHKGAIARLAQILQQTGEGHGSR